MIEKVTEPGVCARSQRHIVYSIEEKRDPNADLGRPTLAVIKFHNSKTNIDKLFCKMKGKIFAFHDKKIYLVTFVHTLRIELAGNSVAQ